MHILSDLTIGYLYRHRELFQEKKGVRQQGLRFFRTTAEKATALVTFYYAVLNNERCIVQVSTKPALRVIDLAVFKSKRVPFVHFLVHVLNL